MYGFHGLDESIAYQILTQQADFKHSNNAYDWLGNGVYFWENNIERARQYATEDSKRNSSKIKKPFVLGVLIDLGNCLDLLDQRWLDFLAFAYDDMKLSLQQQGKDLPTNGAFGQNDFDFKKRELDCAVIRYAHELAAESGEIFDSVRAAFWEGEALYDNAGFKKQNHIQLAILNPNCIKAVFLPRNKEDTLKHDRDLKNITDTARDEGRLEGFGEGLQTAAIAMYKNGLAVDFIAQTLNISLEDVKSWVKIGRAHV